MKPTPQENEEFNQAMTQFTVAQFGVADAVKTDTFSNVFAAVGFANEKERELAACILKLSKVSVK